MSKYIVTGGAGFIGSMLVRKLLERDAAEVAVIDNFSSGRRENLEELGDRVAVHVADIRRFDEIAPLLRGADVVFHLAAIPSVPRSIADPVPSHESNIDGTFQVLRACAEGGVHRVFYAASSSAYGDTEELPKVETMTPRPKSPYALQKLVGEYYATVFASCFGLETVSVRYFNVYGPRQNPSSPYSGIVSLFMKALLERRSPTIHGDGEQSRDFTYVEDVAALSIQAAFARRLRPRLQRRQRQPLHPQPDLGNPAKDRRRLHPGTLRTAPRGRRAPLPGRHRRRRSRPRPRPVLLPRRRSPPHPGVVSPGPPAHARSLIPAPRDPGPRPAPPASFRTARPAPGPTGPGLLE